MQRSRTSVDLQKTLSAENKVKPHGHHQSPGGITWDLLDNYDSARWVSKPVLSQPHSSEEVQEPSTPPKEENLHSRATGRYSSSSDGATNEPPSAGPQPHATANVNQLAKLMAVNVQLSQQLQQECACEEGEQSALQAENAKLRAKNAALQSDNAELQAENERLQTELAQLQSELQDAQNAAGAERLRTGAVESYSMQLYAERQQAQDRATCEAMLAEHYRERAAAAEAAVDGFEKQRKQLQSTEEMLQAVTSQFKKLLVFQDELVTKVNRQAAEGSASKHAQIDGGQQAAQRAAHKQAAKSSVGGNTPAQRITNKTEAAPSGINNYDWAHTVMLEELVTQLQASRLRLTEEVVAMAAERDALKRDVKQLQVMLKLGQRKDAGSERDNAMMSKQPPALFQFKQAFSKLTQWTQAPEAADYYGSYLHNSMPAGQCARRDPMSAQQGLGQAVSNHGGSHGNFDSWIGNTRASASVARTVMPLRLQADQSRTDFKLVALQDNSQDVARSGKHNTHGNNSSNKADRVKATGYGGRKGSRMSAYDRDEFVSISLD